MKPTICCLIILTKAVDFSCTDVIAGSSADISARHFPEYQTSGFGDKVKDVLISENA
jgi:hypothetical protein